VKHWWGFQQGLGQHVGRCCSSELEKHSPLQMHSTVQLPGGVCANRTVLIASDVCGECAQRTAARQLSWNAHSLSGTQRGAKLTGSQAVELAIEWCEWVV
jgi:hypothetical protein